MSVSRSFFDRMEVWEKRLQYLLIICLTCLVTIQFLFARTPWRFYMSFAERLEGISWSDNIPAATVPVKQRGEVKIALKATGILPQAKIIVNGCPVATFRSQEVWVQVKEDDRIEIDGRGYRRQLYFVVCGTSAALLSPHSGQRFSTNGSVVNLGKVILKRQ
jgi:putative ubiquitin-RnfH superfamily antitoxin RatB of RatAB toxin-antitoxin module